MAEAGWRNPNRGRASKPIYRVRGHSSGGTTVASSGPAIAAVSLAGYDKKVELGHRGAAMGHVITPAAGMRHRFVFDCRYDRGELYLGPLWPYRPRVGVARGVGGAVDRCERLPPAGRGTGISFTFAPTKLDLTQSQSQDVLDYCRLGNSPPSLRISLSAWFRIWRWDLSLVLAFAFGHYTARRRLTTLLH